MHSLNDIHLAGLEEDESTIFFKAETREDAFTHRATYKAFLKLSIILFMLLIVVTDFGTTPTIYWWTMLFLITTVSGYLVAEFESFSHAFKFHRNLFKAVENDRDEAPKQTGNQLSNDIKSKGATGTAVFYVDDHGRNHISIINIEIIKTPEDRQNEREAEDLAKLHDDIAERELDPLYPRAEIDAVRREFEAGGHGSRDQFDKIIQTYSVSQLHGFAYGSDDSSLPPVLQLFYQAETNVLPSLSEDERHECFIANRIRRLGAQTIEQQGGGD